jgi:hypothetical protein
MTCPVPEDQMMMMLMMMLMMLVVVVDLVGPCWERDLLPSVVPSRPSSRFRNLPPLVLVVPSFW